MRVVKILLLILVMLAAVVASVMALFGSDGSDSFSSFGEPLKITGVFPANGAVDVPGNSAVEITFSVPPDKLDDYFTVEPETEGRFQYMKEKVAFIPAGGYGGEWANETTYTITVKAGLPVKKGMGKLAEDFTFSFTTQKKDALLYKAVNGYETFLPGDLPVLDLSKSVSWSEQNAPEDGSFFVELYRLENGEDYRDELYRAAVYGGDPWVDTAAMTPILTFSQTVEELTADADPDYPNMKDYYLDIVFPEPLAEGWYVAAATPSWGGEPIQKLLQIQPSAVYIQKNARDIVVWYNSSATGRPMSGASMAVFEDPFASEKPIFTADAGEDGIFLLDIKTLRQEKKKSILERISELASSLSQTINQKIKRGDSKDKDYIVTVSQNGEEEEILLKGVWDDWAAKGSNGTPFLCCSFTSAEGQTYYDVVTSYSWGFSEVSKEDYYGFLYADRPIYHPSDTVKYWGVARPRKDLDAPSTVRVELIHNWGADPVAFEDAVVGPDGVFTGELSYRDLSSGSLALRACLPNESSKEKGNDLEICSEYMEIAQYKKPIYTAGITADKLYYRPGEVIQTQVEVSLFDRTPAAGVDMKVSVGNYGERRSFTTGENGLINAAFPAELFPAEVADRETVSSWRPQSVTITAQNDDASDVDLTAKENIYIFPSSMMLEAEESHDKDSATLTVTANSIDFDKIPGGRQVIQDYETLRGAPVQVDVEVVIHRVTYTRVELPSYYDRYTKTTVPRTAYQREEDLLGSYTLTTGPDGKAILRGLPVSRGNDEQTTYYYADVILARGGIPQRRLVALGSVWNSYANESKGHRHSFHVETSLTTAERPWNSSYRFGETARYQVTDNGMPVKSGVVMVNMTQNSVIGAPLVGEVNGTFTCGEETLPNFYLCGAYFDGTRIYPIYPCELSVDIQSRSLDLQILPAAEDYRPGDIADVTVKLTDENGRPVNGGNVCLGVVDEAVFAVREQNVQMGDDLYGWVSFYFPNVRASYIQHGNNVYYGEGGKGGGGGGDSVAIRENFQDTAAFLTGQTGADGSISFQVRMPDDLTQWRLTAVALDSRAYWGQSKSQLYTTLPFRIDPILSTTFLSGDTIACTVRGFGTGITTADRVEYTATIEGYSQPLEVTAAAPAGENTPLVFQKLPAGDYAITVTARCGEYSDGVKRTFSVRNSALTFPIHRTVTLGEEDFSGIAPTSWPVDLTVCSKGQESILYAWAILRMDNSLRADHRLAMEAARPAMRNFFGDENDYPDSDISDVQITWHDDLDRQGGLHLFPYAEADLRLSARAAVAAPGLVDARELESYLDRALSDSVDPTDQAAALMGLAALDGYRWSEERQQQLKTKARAGGATLLEDLYLIAGVSYLDQEVARNYYNQRVVPLYHEERSGLYLAANTAYDTVEQTAAALTCAVLAGAEKDAKMLVRYLAANAVDNFFTVRGPCQLEVALYLQRFQPAEGKPFTVSYTRNGNRETETISPLGCLEMALGREEWQSLDLQADGAAVAEVSYTGDPEQMGFEPSRRVAVTKTMDTPEDQGHLGGETIVTITVELDPAMPYGQYRLVEWIPSNMRLRSVSQPGEEGLGNRGYYYGYRTDEQLLTVDFERSKNSGDTFTLRYTATSVLDTECALEYCYAYCTETMEGGRSERGNFLPSDYYDLGAG